MNSPTPLNNLLSTAGLRPLIQRCEQLRSLQRLLHQCLDLNLMAHCQLVNLQGHRLVLAVPSPAWASRLRYQIPSLLACLQKQPGMQQLSEIQLRVIPAAEPSGKSGPVRSVSLSAQSASMIADCAKHIDDPGLSQAMLRLARHGQKKDLADN